MSNSQVSKSAYRREYNLTREEAERFWDLIAAKAGARDEWRAKFIEYMTELSQLPKEFRFMGNLGYGGKANFSGQRAYVSCYSEDDTPEREAIKSEINEQLKGLLA